MSKKKVLLVAVIILIPLIIFLVKDDSALDETSTKNLITSTKAKANLASSKEEIERDKEKNKGSYYKGRFLFNPKTDTPMTGLPKDSTFLNKVDPNWENKLTKFLASTDDVDRELEIAHVRSAIVVNGKSLLNIEVVKVNLVNEDGSDGEFKAVVNAETGEIIQTFDEFGKPEIGDSEISVSNSDLVTKKDLKELESDEKFKKLQAKVDSESDTASLETAMEMEDAKNSKVLSESEIEKDAKALKNQINAN